MATIPEFFATQQVEVARVPRASQNIVAAGQGIVAQQIAQTAGQVGQAVVDVATVDFQKQQSRDRVTLAQLKGQWEDFVFLSTPDPTKWKTIEDGQRQQTRFEKDLQRKGASLSHGQTIGVQQDFKVFTELNRVNAKARYANKRVPAERAWALSQMQTRWAGILKNNAGNSEVTEQKLVELVDEFSPYLTPETKRSLMNDVDKSVTQFENTLFIESIKPALVEAINERGNSEDGYEVLDAATAQLIKNGILTEPEAAETNKKLGDWIDSYVSGRIKEAKNADAVATIQSYQEFSKPILNGEMTYDDTGNFRETRRTGEKISDADRWRQYIKGSYKEAPTQSTPEGHTVSFAAVYDVATLQLSPKEGYDVLLEARFVDQSITNEQFEWAVNKIENPYPKYVLENLKSTMKSNLEDFNRFFSADKDRNKKVNEALISWLDAQESPPSKKEMFAMSSAFRAGGGQPHDIGGVIERGGQEWEIVGFDDDGEALVELIE